MNTVLTVGCCVAIAGGALLFGGNFLRSNDSLAAATADGDVEWVADAVAFADDGSMVAHAFVFEYGNDGYLVAIGLAEVNDAGLADVSHCFQVRASGSSEMCRLPIDAERTLVASPSGSWGGLVQGEKLNFDFH